MPASFGRPGAERARARGEFTGSAKAVRCMLSVKFVQNSIKAGGLETNDGAAQRLGSLRCPSGGGFLQLAKPQDQAPREKLTGGRGGGGGSPVLVSLRHLCEYRDLGAMISGLRKKRTSSEERKRPKQRPEGRKTGGGGHVWGARERQRELAKETPCASGTFCIHPSKDPYIDLSPLHPSVFQLSVDPFRELHRSQQLPT